MCTCLVPVFKQCSPCIEFAEVIIGMIGLSNCRKQTGKNEILRRKSPPQNHWCLWLNEDLETRKKGSSHVGLISTKAKAWKLAQVQHFLKVTVMTPGIQGWMSLFDNSMGFRVVRRNCVPSDAALFQSIDQIPMKLRDAGHQDNTTKPMPLHPALSEETSDRYGVGFDQCFYLYPSQQVITSNN